MTSNKQTFTIRLARHGDAEILRDFNSSMAMETEGMVLDGEVALNGVKAILADPGKGFYLLAEAVPFALGRETASESNGSVGPFTSPTAGSVAGSLMVTKEWSDWRNGWFWWIQSVFVAVPFRRKGVYTALYSHVRRMAKIEGNVLGVRLYVDKSNAGAREVYERHGMTESHYAMYEDDL